MTQHDKLLELLNPLVDFLIENKYNYFIVAGKDDLCSRHLRGNSEDITGMVKGLVENHPAIHEAIKEAVV